MASERRDTTGNTTVSRGRERLSTRFALVDDRGCVHRVNLRELHESPDQRVRYVSVLAWRQAGRPPRALFTALFLCMPVVGALGVWAFSGTWLGSTLGKTGGFTIFVVGYFASVGAIFRYWSSKRFRSHGGEVATVFLSNGLCPICAYAIGATPTEPDGCVVCAECGSAWHADRVRPLGMSNSAEDLGLPERIGMRTVGWSNRRIHDAEGRPQTLLDGDYRRAIALAGSPDHRERLLEARRVLRRSAGVRRLVGYGLTAFLGLGMAVAAYANLVQAWPPVSAGLLLQFIGALCLPLTLLIVSLMIVNPFGHSADKEVAVRELLKRSLCPSCGADLSGERKSNDGRCRCTRCLAMWQLSGKSG